jgi:RES domain-containing protein
MAALEKYVNLPRPIPRRLYFAKFRIRFAGVPALQPRISELPRDWRSEPAPTSTQDFGDAWLKEGATPILAVPSVLIPEEINFVLNPVHPDFSKIEISPAEAFTFDPRLARLLDPQG